MSPIRKSATTAPTLRNRKRTTTARKSMDKPAFVPPYSLRPIPDPGPCGRRGCHEDPCGAHCSAAGKAGRWRHKVDGRFLGWAKGHGDGTFDVACQLCGEVGWVRVVPAPADVAWG